MLVELAEEPRPDGAKEYLADATRPRHLGLDVVPAHWAEVPVQRRARHVRPGQGDGK